MQAGLEDIRTTLRTDRKRGRKTLIVSVILFIAVVMVILCFDYEGYINSNIVHWITPWHAIRSLYDGAKNIFLVWIQDKGEFGAKLYAAHYGYLLEDGIGPLQRFLHVLLTAVAGAVLSVAGTVYQSAMRNPMAVPTMLGVTSSVNLAKMLILVNLGIDAFYHMTWQMYAFCYGISAIVLLIILVAGKLSGGKKVSVVDMLLAGTIINRLLQTFVSYLQDTIDEDTLMLYQEISQRSYDYFGILKNLAIMVVLTTVVMIPILLMRFSYNAISFEDEDARSFGVNPNGMRIYAMVAGAVLTVAAMIHFGDIGTLALIVPHICRYAFGTEFRRVITTSAFYGAFILVVGWFISNFTWIGLYQIPVGSIVSLIVIPVLIWFSFKQRRGWN